MSLKDLKWKLEFLSTVFNNHPLYNETKKKILAERQPEIDKLKAEIEKLQKKQPKKKPRWPENTPDHIIKACENYWSGTEEFWSFRIHVWNDKAVWTSWGSGGYSTNGGWVKVSPCYFLISLTETKNDMGRQRSKILVEIDVKRDDRGGKKVTKKELLQVLEEKTK